MNRMHEKAIKFGIVYGMGRSRHTELALVALEKQCEDADAGLIVEYALEPDRINGADVYGHVFYDEAIRFDRTVFGLRALMDAKYGIEPTAVEMKSAPNNPWYRQQRRKRW